MYVNEAEHKTTIIPITMLTRRFFPVLFSGVLFVTISEAAIVSKSRKPNQKEYLYERSQFIVLLGKTILLLLILYRNVVDKPLNDYWDGN